MDDLYIDDGYTVDDIYFNGGIYIEWGIRNIYVPRQFGTLIQSVPTEIRQIDIDDFRRALKDLEDDEDGMIFPDTHNNNPPVTVGGLTLARVLEIINNYTVTFEDGEYTVQLVGANSNIADVVNRNRVSVASNNSAGLVDNSSAGLTLTNTEQIIQISDFVRKLLANKVTISPDNSTTVIFDDDKVTPVHTFTHADERNRDPV